MTLLKSTSFILVSALFTASFAQAENCFTNLATYEAAKAELPTAFQKNPIALKCGNCGSPTGITVQVTAGGIMSTMLTAASPDRLPVQKICINGPGKLTIYGKYTLPVVANGNSVVINSPLGPYNMTVTSMTALQAHINGGNAGNTAFGGNR